MQSHPNTVVTIVNKKNSNSNYGNYQVRMMQDKNGKPIGYSAYNPNTGNNILMKLEELKCPVPPRYSSLSIA
jgi:hypothetical protein